MNKPVILWFRRDLRLADNPALEAAVNSGRAVILVYILDDETPGRWSMGGASRWWLHYSLAALENALKARGGRLILRRGRTDVVLTGLVRETGAGAVFFSRRYEPHAAALEADVASAFSGTGVEVRRFGGGLLFEPEDVMTRAGQPFKVFTPFYKACRARPTPSPPKAPPKRIPAPDTMPDGERLEAWDLRPSKPDWSGGLRETWTPGEEGAQARLDAFVDHGVAGYATMRDRPDRPGTSRLSPHLHFGEISPRACWHRVMLSVDMKAGKGGRGAESFLREIIWREFSHHLLHHWPTLPERPFRSAFGDFPWAENDKALCAWQRGRTGYPIVDAGLRELWHTGWMHNRVRMIVASFLVKHLLIPWQAGEDWFWDTLVDADLANNAASWQWVAGCGADAAPYFRIFNPMLQGRKFDPDGAYVRQWVPELAGLPDAHIHQPWLAAASVLKDAGVALGEAYPRPVVDHAEARRRALAAFKKIKR